MEKEVSCEAREFAHDEISAVVKAIVDWKDTEERYESAEWQDGETDCV